MSASKSENDQPQAGRGAYAQALTELLRILSDDFDEEVVARSLWTVQRVLGASRVYLLRLDDERRMLRLVDEVRMDDSVKPLEPGLEYSADEEKGWDSVRDENWVYAPDVADQAAIDEYGLNVRINESLGVRSLYGVRFAAEGRNWGSLGVTYEKTPHQVDGTEWWFILTAANMMQLAIVRNERLHALEAERDRARAAEEAKSYFFSTVSHDIRTPLNAIVGYAELLKLGIADETERKKAIDSVLVSSHALLELINDVLDLSKLEAGRMEILPEPVDVVKLIRETAETFRASLGEKPVEIRTEVRPMPWLKLDPHRIRQILFNIVGNAVKFTSKGHIEIKAEYEKGTFRLTISDTGCGISEEDKLRIAQPYVQVGNATSRNKGTGLGLAICCQLARKMGGDIEVQSLLGCGSTFFVTIPGVIEENGSRRARLSATQRIRYAVEKNVKAYRRVLVVDDQPMNQMVLKTMLTRFGVGEIVLAGNGVAALERLRNAAEPFDLVLTDMWMPEMDGEGLVKEIRRNPAWKTLPVYAVTADVEAQKDYASLGFTGLLLKPLTLEKLKGLLR